MLRPLALSLILHLVVILALGMTFWPGDSPQVEASLDFEVLPGAIIQPQPAHRRAPPASAAAKAAAVAKATAMAEAATGKDSVAEAQLTPAPAALVSGASDGKSAVKSSYASDLRVAIEAEKRYPRVARARGESGTVEVAFTLRKNGVISDIHIARASPFPTLDREAAETLRRLGHFKPVPDEVAAGDWKVIVPLEFKLEE